MALKKQSFGIFDNYDKSRTFCKMTLMHFCKVWLKLPSHNQQVKFLNHHVKMILPLFEGFCKLFFFLVQKGCFHKKVLFGVTFSARLKISYMWLAVFTFLVV